MFNKMALSVVLASCITATAAQSLTNIQTRKDSSAYVEDARGVVVRSGFGLCWRTGYWTPADSLAGCDGELAPPVLKVTAPAPAPAAVSVEPIAPVATKRCDFYISLSHEQTFEFDRAILTSEAKSRIDSEVIGKLTGCAKTDLIAVTGHTDRIGSTQYNKALSQKRAAVVASYLTDNGVSAPVTALGMGMNQPVKNCAGKIVNKELIRCLAPNRRVVIETKTDAK